MEKYSWIVFPWSLHSGGPDSELVSEHQATAIFLWFIQLCHADIKYKTYSYVFLDL